MYKIIKKWKENHLNCYEDKLGRSKLVDSVLSKVTEMEMLTLENEGFKLINEDFEEQLEYYTDSIVASFKFLKYKNEEYLILTLKGLKMGIVEMYSIDNTQEFMGTRIKYSDCYENCFLHLIVEEYEQSIFE